MREALPGLLRFGLLLFIAGFVLSMPRGTLADVIELKGGGRITGEVIARDDDAVAVQVSEGGRVYLAQDDIEWIIIGTPDQIRNKRVIAGYFEKGSRAYEADRFEEAAQAYARAARLAPEYAAFHNNLGVCLLRLDRLGEAIDAFERAWRQEPQDPIVLKNLARACDRDGRFYRAGKIYAQLTDSVPAGPVLAEWGAMLYRHREFTEAYEKFLEALKTDPENARYVTNLGSCLAALGEIDEARAEFRRALALEPGLEVAEKNLTELIYFENGASPKGLPESR